LIAFDIAIRNRNGGGRLELENHERKLNGGSGDLPCRLIECPIDEIRAHDSYVKHGLFVSASKLSQLIAAGDAVLTQPIIVTRTRAIIDGYGRGELAKRYRALRGKHSLYLSFIIGRSVAASPVHHNHAISGIHLHRNRENVLDLALQRCLARFAGRDSVD